MGRNGHLTKSRDKRPTRNVNHPNMKPHYNNNVERLQLASAGARRCYYDEASIWIINISSWPLITTVYSFVKWSLLPVHEVARGSNIAIDQGA
ncbi:hypothetical protein HAX54_013586 [Datura stramonium]|uniref:Uncharacterized protein n=1 Tax=Datura stramonium TaxID=4076 RepID=A0ABS8TLD6_DATST|nr:hypothetical protein [Datura stramonium]